MTMTTAPAQRRSVTIQRVLTTASIVACLPYLTLKLSWLAGFELGRVPGSDWGTTMWIANLGTASMEAYAVFLAVAFVASWRRRVPDVVVLLPMWIATGFLAVIVVGLPIQLAIGIDTTTDSGSPLALEPWVWPMVYAGFFVLGVSLIANFVLDARAHYVPRLGRASGDGLVVLVAAGVACAVITLKVVGFVESGFGGTGVADTVLIVAAVAVAPALAYAQRRGTTLAAALVWSTGAPFLSIGIFLLALSAVSDELADIPGHATIGAVLMVTLGLIAGRTLHSMIGRRQPSYQESVTRNA